mmetsp:Transcript_6274/g.7777  ORF Transcript_6274/g.7777 Transcript_6274/m.7777 type:complete len:81 (+) Transcript_6274:194-436(+)
MYCLNGCIQGKIWVSIRRIQYIVIHATDLFKPMGYSSMAFQKNTDLMNASNETDETLDKALKGAQHVLYAPQDNTSSKSR